jgi:rhodanese-related sulfurtransferase
MQEIPMVTEIGRGELKQKLDHPKKSILVEALPEEQFRKVHLPGAINLPAREVRTLAPDLLPTKDIEVIVYCVGPACHASREAADELTAMGYSNVRHYVGGKQDWINAGLPVIRNGDERAIA